MSGESLLPELRRMDPAKTIGKLASFAIPHENLEKISFIELAIRTAAGNCRGTKTPSLAFVHRLLRETGQSRYPSDATRRYEGLSAVFAGQSAFLRGIEGSADQSIDAAWKRFHAHDAILVEKLGYTVGNAIYLSRTLVNLIHSRTIQVEPQRRTMMTSRRFHDFSYFVKPEPRILVSWPTAVQFSRDDVVSSVPPAVRSKVAPFLESISMRFDDFPPAPDPYDESPLLDRPVVRIGDTYILPLLVNLFRGMSSRIHRALITDRRYRGPYGNSKGGVLEEWAAEALRRAFPSALILRNLSYKTEGTEGEADIVLSFSEYLLFVECTTKWIQPQSNAGVVDAIHFDLAHSVAKCYRQARRARNAYLAGDLKLSPGVKPAKIICVVVTDTLYPNLVLEMSKEPGGELPRRGRFLRELVEEGDFPYIVSVFDIEALTEMVNERRLIEFIAERTELSKRGAILAFDEPDYLRFYLKPEYRSLRALFSRGSSVLNFVGSPELPVRKSPLLLSVFDAIGSEGFTIFDLRSAVGRRAEGVAMETLYSVYCGWDEAGAHLVHDLEGFRLLLVRHRSAGKPCKAVAWDGFREFVRTKKEPSKVQMQIVELAVSNGLNALIAYSYDYGLESLFQEQEEKGEADMMAFLERRRSFAEAQGPHVENLLSDDK